MNSWAVAKLVIELVPDVKDRGEAFDTVWDLVDGRITPTEATQQLTGKTDNPGSMVARVIRADNN